MTLKPETRDNNLNYVRNLTRRHGQNVSGQLHGLQ